MAIPDDLQENIDRFFENTTIQKLKKASALLSKHYLDGISLTSEEELLAYLIVRLPATYAALRSVLSQLPVPGTLLDLGAGPGTASWAIHSLWNSPTKITAIEKEPYFIELGKKLKAQVTWIQGDLSTFSSFEKHSWVLFGYSLGELHDKEGLDLIKKAWDAALQGVIIVEPGTPRGYRKMLEARQALIQMGGFVLAPCPHSNACPLPPSDWCHFSTRVERSSLHRQAKEGTLSYEDEKYSYVIVTKEPHPTTASRIIRHPLHRPGHIILPLCTPNGLEEITVTRSHKEKYKKARKIHWGDQWSNP